MRRLVALTLLAVALSPAEAVPPPAPVGPVPSARQMKWQALDAYAFFHFGPNTFTGREWGTGEERPELFAPTQLDCRQWAQVIKAAGLKGAIITAKHHDGFCLWPSAFSDHTIAKSAGEFGRRDIIRELSEACREQGLLFGVYVSPWDRNHPAYGTPEYNDVFKKMLGEVLSRYGPIFEVWFDGANGEGPNGKRQEYDWPGFIETVRRLQPDACIFSDAGPDVRWVGNESGRAAVTNWAPLKRDLFAPGSGPSAQLPSGHEDGTDWVPAECDVSIRPGWFYHPEEDDRVKSGLEIMELYYASAGRNANLLLNIPPDRNGLIAAPDQKALKDFRRLLDATFKTDLARKRPASASNVRGGEAAFAPSNVTDGDPATYWATDDAVTEANLTVDLGGKKAVNRLLLREYVPLGQRVKAFRVEARDGSEWKTIAEGTTIGYRRILRFDTVQSDALRLVVTSSKACPVIEALSAYCAPPEVTIRASSEMFTKDTRIELTTDVPGAKIRYTLNGKKPTFESTLYRGPFTLDRTAVISAIAETRDASSLWPAVRGVRKVQDSDFRPADLPLSTAPGLRYEYFETGLQSLGDLGDAKPVAEGEAATFDIGSARRADRFAFRFAGFVEVPQDGAYTFELASDDGSRLWLGKTLVLDNDGLHGAAPVRVVVPLKAGKHAVVVGYFNATGASSLRVSLSGPGITEGPIGSGLLTH